jgi:hypothetical protein
MNRRCLEVTCLGKVTVGSDYDPVWSALYCEDFKRDDVEMWQYEMHPKGAFI